MSNESLPTAKVKDACAIFDAVLCAVAKPPIYPKETLELAHAMIKRDLLDWADDPLEKMVLGAYLLWLEREANDDAS